MGSTDGDNTTEINMRLRALRAEAARDALIGQGVAPDVLKVVENNNLYGDTARGVKFRVELWKKRYV